MACTSRASILAVSRARLTGEPEEGGGEQVEERDAGREHQAYNKDLAAQLAAVHEVEIRVHHVQLRHLHLRRSRRERAIRSRGDSR